MILKNFFLEIFEKKSKNPNLAAGGAPKSSAEKAEALTETLDDLTNQQIINLTAALEGDKGLSAKESKILKTLGILQSLDQAGFRKEKFNAPDKVIALVNSTEFDDFLTALKKTDFWDAYQEHLGGRVDTMATSAGDRLAVATEVTAASVELADVKVTSTIEGMAKKYKARYPDMTIKQIADQIIADSPGTKFATVTKKQASASGAPSWMKAGIRYALGGAGTTIKIRTSKPAAPPIPESLRVSATAAPVTLDEARARRTAEDELEVDVADAEYEEAEDALGDALQEERLQYTDGLHEGTYDSRSDRWQERREFRDLKGEKVRVKALKRWGRAHEWSVHFRSLDTEGAMQRTAKQLLGRDPFGFNEVQLKEKPGSTTMQEIAKAWGNKTIRFNDILWGLNNLHEPGSPNYLAEGSFKEFSREYERLSSKDTSRKLHEETKEKEALLRGALETDPSTLQEVKGIPEDLTKRLTKKYVNTLARRKTGETTQQWKERVEAERERLDRETWDGKDKEVKRNRRKRKIDLCDHIIDKLEEEQKTHTQDAQEAYDAALAAEQAHIEKLERYELIIEKTFELFDALGGLVEGEEQVEYEREDLSERYDDPDQQALFDEIRGPFDDSDDKKRRRHGGDGYTEFDRQKERKLGSSRRTDELTRRYDLTGIVEEIEAECSVFEDGRRVLKKEKVEKKMRGLLMAGFASLESREDFSKKKGMPIEILDLAELLGVYVESGRRNKIKAKQKELKGYIKEQEKAQEDIDESNEKIAKLVAKLENKSLRDKTESVARIEEKIRKEYRKQGYKCEPGTIIPYKHALADSPQHYKEHYKKKADEARGKLVILYKPILEEIKAPANLEKLLHPDPESENYEDMQEAQEILMRLGYLSGRGVEQSEQTTTLDSLFEYYTKDTHPVQYAVLTAIKNNPDKTYTSEELELIMAEINHQTEHGFEPDNVTENRISGGAGVATDEYAGLTRVSLTKTFKLPENLGVVNVDLHFTRLGLPAASAGYSNRIINTKFMDIGISAQVNPGTVSASVSGTVSIGKEQKGQIILGAGVGVGLEKGQFIFPSLNIGVAFYDSPQDNREQKENRELSKAGLTQIREDAPSNDPQLMGEYLRTAIREGKLPQFQSTLENLEATVTGNTAAQKRATINRALWLHFNLVEQDARTSAQETVRVFPIRGGGIAIMGPNELLKALNLEPKRKIPIPIRLPIPFLTFVAKGRTMVVPYLPEGNTLAELTGRTDEEIDQLMEDNFYDPDYPAFDEMAARSGGLQLDVSGELEPDGSRKVGNMHMSLGTSLEDYNEEFENLGMSLVEGPHETLRLNFFENRLQGTVEIHADSKADPPIELIGARPDGAPATHDDIYLAFDRLEGELYIEVREMRLARPDEFGNTTRTIIHIKNNPRRTRHDIDRDDRGYLLGAVNRSFVEREEDSTARADHVWDSWEEAEANGVFERQEARTTVDEYKAAVTASDERMQRALKLEQPTPPEGRQADEPKLAKLAEDLMDNRAKAKRFKELSTMTFEGGEMNFANRPALARFISEHCKAEYPNGLNDNEMNYILNRLVVESFAQNQTNEKLLELQKWFTGQLSTALQATETLRSDPTTAALIAEKIVGNIDYTNLDRTKIGNGAEVLDKDKYGNPYGNDIYASVVVGSGVKGLRHMLSLAGIDKGDLMEVKTIEESLPDEATKVKYRAAMLELTSPIPKNRAELLRCPLGVKFAGLAPVLLGPEHSDKLAEMYEMNTAQLAATLAVDGPYKRVFEKFEQLIVDFRAMQKGDLGKIEWTNMDGLKFILRDNSEYWTGIYKKCGNPSLFVHESVSIMQVERFGSAGAEALQEGDYHTDRNIFEFFAYYSHTEYKKGKPKKKEREREKEWEPEEPEEEQPEGGKDPTRKQDLSDIRESLDSSDRGTDEGTAPADDNNPTGDEDPPPE